MKKNIITILTLVIITSFSGLFLFAVNEITSPIIAANMSAQVDELAKEIFADTVETVSNEIIDNEYVTEEIVCFNVSGEIIGYLYKATGSNAFGSITILVGFDEDVVVQVEFLSLSQSYADVARTHTDETYNEDSLSIDDLDGLNLTSGATYSSTLINTLIIESAKVYGDNNEK